MSFSKAIFRSSEDDDILISYEDVVMLKNMALESSQKRARICMHKNHQDKVQEMLIAMCKESYVPPHRQKNKEKSYCVLEGELLVVFFDELGVKKKHIVLEAGKSFFYRFDASTWHNDIGLSETVVYSEVISGPFDVSTTTDFASFAPFRDNYEDGLKYNEAILKGI